MVFYKHLKTLISLDPHLLQEEGRYSVSKQPFFDTISLPETRLSKPGIVRSNA